MATVLNSIETGFIQRDDKSGHTTYWFWVDGYHHETDTLFEGESYGVVEYKAGGETDILDDDGDLVNPEGFEMTPEGVKERILRSALIITNEMRRQPADVRPQDVIVRMRDHRRYIVQRLSGNGYDAVDTMSGQHIHIAKSLVDQRLACGLYEIRSA